MEESKDNVQRPFKGMVTDMSPSDQPKETYRYALNAVNKTEEGNSNFLAMEKAIEACVNFPEGSRALASIYMVDDLLAIFLVDNDGYSYIGTLNKLNVFNLYIKTKILNLSDNYPISGTFRIRRNSTKIIYWGDGHNKPRLFNFDRPFDFYSYEYEEWLSTHSDFDIYEGEMWEDIKFDLIKTYTEIPSFDNVEILIGGNIVSGSYNISIQLIDENLSPTEWITTSNPVTIYVDSTEIRYSEIRGSRNSNTDAQNFQFASKSIKWKFGNLDENFSFYRIAVLIANSNNGNINKVLVSQLIPISHTEFIYSGNDGDFTTTPLSDILQNSTDINSVKYIEQLESRLIFAGIKGKQINWCNFQAYASKIQSVFVNKNIVIDNINSIGAPKNPKTNFTTVGYMFGEVYSFGIVYVFKDGYKSPAYHIPGRPIDGVNGMDFYECENNVYPPIHSCDTDYWGVNSYNQEHLLNTNIRHHKFPRRNTDLYITNNNSTTTDICGIKFFNIEKPNPDVIGFFIVRNERTEDDKIVIDNALVGALTCDSTDSANPYQTFGLILPDLPDTKKSTSGVFIFSPEHQFKNKKITFDRFDVIGSYTKSGKYVQYDYEAGVRGNGVYIEDVRPGTTFNSKYNRGEDPDGFDLQILYRSNQVSYSTAAVNEIVLPNKEKLFYLSAANNMTRDTEIFFNASIDNKIIVSTFNIEHEIPNYLFTDGGVPRLLYTALLKNNITAYSNFINRTYYKETNNITLFGNEEVIMSDNIFNGDSHVAPMTLNSSTYYDTHFASRDKKSRVWKIILGGVLIAAGIAGLIFSAGASSTLIAAGLATAVATTVVTAATVMAISYGVSSLTSGIEFETMKNMIDQYYEAGLKNTIKDIDNKDSNYKANPALGDDDRFQWFVDRLQNIYFESAVNIGLRSGLTVSVSDFLNSPTVQPLDNLSNISSTAAKESYEVYLSNKFTVVDREQSSGRLYLGYASAEIYDINIDYLRQNHEKHYFHLPIEYDCSSSKIEEYNNRIFYSEQSFQEEKLDTYRTFLSNNYKDIEGQFGEITGIFRFNNTLYIHTTESLLVLPQNMQERINQELVTFIGTGEFFAIPPKKVMDGESGSFGSSDNKSTVITRKGVFFTNTKEGIPYILTSKPEDISSGNSVWFKNNLKLLLYDYLEALSGIYYTKTNNNINEESVGIHAIYDSTLNRIILTKIDYIPLIPLTLYNEDWQLSVGKITYNDIDGKFYMGSANGYIHVPFSNTNYFENKSWTMSFSFDTNSWVSYHSYLPRIYMNTPSSLYSAIGSTLYKHHSDNKFCKFYGIKYPYVIEYVSVSNPLITRTFDTVSIIAMAKKYLPEYKSFVENNSIFFDRAVFSNSRQCSGEVNLIVRSQQQNTNNYLLNQVSNTLSTCITEKIEGVWTVNMIRDYLSNYNKPFFLSDWLHTKDVYPIDKVVNQSVINSNKLWYELESLRDNHLVIRLIFSNFGDNDIQLITNYSIENEQQSLR